METRKKLPNVKQRDQSPLVAKIKKSSLARCPITHDEVENPQVTPTGHTFSKKPIKEWLKIHSTNPLDPSSELTVEQLRPNFLLQEAQVKFAKFKEMLLTELEAIQEPPSKPSHKRKAGCTMKTAQRENKRLKRELGNAQRSEVDAELTIKVLQDELLKTQRDVVDATLEIKALKEERDTLREENRQLKRTMTPVVYSRKKSQRFDMFAGGENKQPASSHTESKRIYRPGGGKLG